MSMRIDGTNTTANPGITGADTDTGLQFGTNEVSIVTDGEEQVKVDSGGRVLFEKAVRFQYNTDSTDSRTWMLSNDVHSNGDFAFRRSDAQTSTSFDTKILFKDSGGICFNGDTAAANALDDYEEGTWTPAISNTGYTFTYDTQEGQYTKIGRLVTLRFRITVTARSGSASGGHPIINLPITSDGNMDGGNFRFVMPSELVVHKAGTSGSSGAKTLLFGGFGNSNTSNFWVNNPTVTNTNPFDLGSNFHLGGVITYTA